ncbi:MAG TPA: FAD-binding oxidoreductase, partial [Chloroflexota bacterium]
MGTLSAQLRSSLEVEYGDRVSFRKTERKLYGHDVAAMPSLVKPLVGNTVPDAVVQPQTEEELASLVRRAYEDGIAVTPRGKATSGYGGVLPLKQGLVIDFYRLSRLLDVDRERLTARVQAGMVWEKLDAELAKHGLMLRTYPTSYPASTVGGWLAQGGAGIGGFESGWFLQNVVSARVVMPDGTIKEFEGPELELISDAEGTTGLISDVTIKVQPLEELGIVAVACPRAEGFQKLVRSIVDAKLPVWSIGFINPKMAAMKNQSPVKEHGGHEAEHVTLPEAYISTIAFRESDREAVMGGVSGMLRPGEAELLSDEIAQHEWENRFNLMLVKRLGPSLVPSEMVIPLSSFAKVMAEVGTLVQQPIVKEGVIIRDGAKGEPEVVILGFIPADQRKFSYNFVFGLVVTIM